MKALIHYSEIGLKGLNRDFFEDKLLENIREALTHAKVKARVEREHGRINCEFGEKDKGKCEVALKKVFGIKYFAFAEDAPLSEKGILDGAEVLLKNLKKNGAKKIASVAKRSDKNFALDSNELNKKIGTLAVKLGFGIDLDNPDARIFTEITSKRAYLYIEKISGLAGLPVGSSAKTLCLFSGGIDSVVAAFLMMKRGSHVDFLHFHALRDGKEVLNSKIKKLIESLNAYQTSSELYIAPYHTFQLEIGRKVDERVELVLFRNFMLRIAQEIALRDGYSAIITGDSLGQVASQTGENLLAANFGVEIPVFRPLISFDKDEIIEIARKIGTFDLSVEKYKDCCSIISRKPATAVRPEKFRKELSKVDLQGIIAKTLEEIEVQKIT